MKVGRKHYKTVWFEKNAVSLIDQNALPYRFKIVRCHNHIQTSEAIKNMVVRGAGAIGVAAGFAMAQVVRSCPNRYSRKNFLARLSKGRKIIENTRPTARNLFYATERVFEAARCLADEVWGAKKASLKEALLIAEEDERSARRIGEAGKNLIFSGCGILTHCNAGWLAFSDWGTALAPLYVAKREGKKFFVYVDETRPRSQGARLTAWELGHENIPHAVIADAAAGSLIRRKKIHLILVGADRIAANGDVANKIGTYTLAVLAKENGIPFFVAAPLSTFDLKLESGEKIPIENRSKEELFGKRWFRALTKSLVENPAFDITPARYIKGIITEKGIVEANRKAIRKLFIHGKV